MAEASETLAQIVAEWDASEGRSVTALTIDQARVHIDDPDHQRERMVALLEKMIEEWPQVMTDEEMNGGDCCDSLVRFVMEAREITGETFLMPSAPMPVAPHKRKWLVPVAYHETCRVKRDVFVEALDEDHARTVALAGEQYDEGEENDCEPFRRDSVMIDTGRGVVRMPD